MTASLTSVRPLSASIAANTVTFPSTDTNPDNEHIARMRAALEEMATALARKAAHLRAAINDLDNHSEDVSPLEVLSILGVHGVRVTEADLALHQALQDAAHGLLLPTRAVP